MAIAEKAEKKQEKPKKERTGRVDQIIGPVVDVVFEAQDLPEIYHALEIDRGKQGRLVLEVQQHRGNDRQSDKDQNHRRRGAHGMTERMRAQRQLVRRGQAANGGRNAGLLERRPGLANPEPEVVLLAQQHRPVLGEVALDIGREPHGQVVFQPGARLQIRRAEHQAKAVLAADEHICVGRSDALHQLEHRLHCAGRGDEIRRSGLPQNGVFGLDALAVPQRA